MFMAEDEGVEKEERNESHRGRKYEVGNEGS
jgi:hypothetical protein